jgi:hypothetical protein
LEKIVRSIQLWQGPDGIEIPASISEPNEILAYANDAYLTSVQQNKIINAFKGGAYDMAAEYAWKRAMVKLKDTLATLGMGFIGEMLNRTDIEKRWGYLVAGNQL